MSCGDQRDCRVSSLPDFRWQRSGIRRSVSHPLGELTLRYEVVGIDTQPTLPWPAPRPRSGRAFDYARSRRSPAAGIRCNSKPPWPLAATAMLPPMRKARPPNIFCSVRFDSAGNQCPHPIG